MSEFSFGPLASEDIVLDSVSQGPFLMGVVLVMHFWPSLGCHQPTILKGNGNPLQYSGLEYPMDGEAW